MDEESREDFFRLKRVTDKKKQDKAEALREADLKGSVGGEGKQDNHEDSIFGNGDEDEDLVF